MNEFKLEDLAAIIRERTSSSAENSYTKSLLDAGMGRVAKKFGEEAVEAVIAAIQADRSALISESADVLYHLLVVLQSADIPLSEVLAELERRTSRSGIEEKNSRNG